MVTSKLINSANPMQINADIKPVTLNICAKGCPMGDSASYGKTLWGLVAPLL